MAIEKLAHYSIRTHDLDASRRFYVDLLGLRPGYRPPFPFPGVWLYAGEGDDDHGVVHLIGITAPDELAAYLGNRPLARGTGALDHIAFVADDWPRMKANCDECGVPYVERTVPLLGLHQVFVTDPSGVVIELNFL